MKNKIFCSFIVATYNREEYLARCVDSILAQTYVDFELIIVNDGSTDESESIIQRYKDDRIKYFLLDHKGCWSAKNYGIKRTTGEFLCFIDSDDFISNDFLSIGAYAVKQNPLFDYYYPTALNIVKEDGASTKDIWRYISYSLSEREKLVKLFWDRQIGGIPHVASLIKRDVFDRCGLYNDTFFNLSDTDYIVRNALNIRFLLVPELGKYFNRQHPKQTNTNIAERMRTYSEILDHIIHNYDTNIFLDKNLEKESIEFNQICVEKFMQLANKTEHKEHYLLKAETYLRKCR